MARYIAFLRELNDAQHEIEFPDLPGCRVRGSSLAVANALASEALLHHLTVLMNLGYPAPEPSTEEQLAENPRRAGAAMMAFEFDPGMLSIANPLIYHTL